MANITEKSTKAEILAAYNETQKMLCEKNSTKFDPTTELREKKAIELTEKVESVKMEELEKMVREFDVTLSLISKNLEVYNDIKEAIKIKEVELREMFEIEKAAYTLSALINTQDEAKEKFNIEMAAKKLELEQLIKVTQEEIKLLKTTALNEIDQINNNAKIARKQEEEKYTYDTTRQRKIDSDKFYDEMNEKRKEYDLAVQALLLREKNIDELDESIKQLKSQREEDVKNAIEETEKKIKISHVFETSYLKKDYESKIELLNSKIEALTQTLEDTKNSNAILTTKLDEAYSKIENMARATIESGSSKDMINTLKGALSDKNVNGK